MTDLDFSVPDGFKRANFDIPFLDNAGPYFVKRGKSGQHLVGCHIRPLHVNYIGIAHGGVLTTLADVALSYQAFRYTDPPTKVATISLTTNFLSGARLGDWVLADCQIDRVGKQMTYVRGAIFIKEKVIMTATAVFKNIAAKT
ncbi:MAG: PaaI family thioesterase [Pseudomonadota bacterium]